MLFRVFGVCLLMDRLLKITYDILTKSNNTENVVSTDLSQHLLLKVVCNSHKDVRNVIHV